MCALYSTGHSIETKIIDGKRLAAEIQDEVREEIKSWIGNGHRNPCLKAILIGDDPASETYVKKKMIASNSVGRWISQYFFFIYSFKYMLMSDVIVIDVGIDSETIKLPCDTSEEEIIEKIKQLNNDPSVDGILVQLPVPEHVSERNVCNAVDPQKDIDGFHISNVGSLALNMDTFVPCTALAVVEIIKR